MLRYYPYLNSVIQIHACVFFVVGSLQIFLVRIFFIIIFNLGICGASGYIAPSAFGTDGRMDGDGGGYHLAVSGCGASKNPSGRLRFGTEKMFQYRPCTAAPPYMEEFFAAGASKNPSGRLRFGTEKMFQYRPFYFIPVHLFRSHKILP